MSSNIFCAISGDLPIPVRSDHPVPRSKICTRSAWSDNQAQTAFISRPPDMPLQTNKFYANMLLGEQGNSVWTHPYSVCWAKGAGNAKSWGLSISHIEREQLALGPVGSNGAVQYFLSPIGIQSMLLSAAELSATSSLNLDSLDAFSTNANLAPTAGVAPIVTFPLVQGMGFVTAKYKQCTPLIQSSVFFRELTVVGTLDNGATTKYRALLEDGKIWLIYLTPTSPSGGAEQLSKTSNSCYQARQGYSGTIQVAKLPAGADEGSYDASAGAYPISCKLSATSSGNNAQYVFQWGKAGSSKPLIIYALPHHVQSFDPNTASKVTGLRLQTTTKGQAVGVLADEWRLNESLPVDIGFGPWRRDTHSASTLSTAAISAINAAAKVEVEQDMIAQSSLDSMYFSGKGLAKFAMMITALLLARNSDLAKKGLDKLKAAFAVFIENRQPNPLVYDACWKGVVSTGGLRGDPGVDFGNSFFNDHHFHYGYFVYTAAVIGTADSAWLAQGNNKAWVNMLVKDYANPVQDNMFPFSRSFDYWCGHSWAKGLFESGDGKDQESTSEDAFASYALKLWGKTIGDTFMEARGNLMLAIQARTFTNYFLMESSNKVQPPQFIGNKVTGILFENKVDHATYFGANVEYIQGIHMIPINPTSAMIRNPNFVREEWETYFSNGRVDSVAGGWRGILYSNLCLIDPKKAYGFFSRDDFDWGWLDGGMSRTWYLAYCAAMGGA